MAQQSLRTTGMRIFFCDLASPGTRGSEMKTPKGLLRQYFQKVLIVPRHILVTSLIAVALAFTYSLTSKHRCEDPCEALQSSEGFVKSVLNFATVFFAHRAGHRLAEIWPFCSP